MCTFPIFPWSWFFNLATNLLNSFKASDFRFIKYTKYILVQSCTSIMKYRATLCDSSLRVPHRSMWTICYFYRGTRYCEVTSWHFPFYSRRSIFHVHVFIPHVFINHYKLATLQCVNSVISRAIKTYMAHFPRLYRLFQCCILFLRKTIRHLVISSCSWDA